MWHLNYAEASVLLRGDTETREQMEERVWVWVWLRLGFPKSQDLRRYFRKVERFMDDKMRGGRLKRRILPKGRKGAVLHGLEKNVLICLSDSSRMLFLDLWFRPVNFRPCALPVQLRALGDNPAHFGQPLPSIAQLASVERVLCRTELFMGL